MNDVVVDEAKKINAEIEAEEKEDSGIYIDASDGIGEATNLAAMAMNPNITQEQAAAIEQKINDLKAKALEQLRDEMKAYKEATDEKVQSVINESRERQSQFERILEILENANKPAWKQEGESEQKPQPQDVTPRGADSSAGNKRPRRWENRHGRKRA